MPENFWAELPLGDGVEALTRDANGLAAFCKPAGTLSHPNGSEDQARALLTVPYTLAQECYEWEGKKLWLLNRLDSATSGVILATADEKLAVEIRAQFKRKAVRKIYVALVFGTPRAPIELWRDLLAVDKRGGQIRTAAGAGRIPAECRMTVVRTGEREPKLALLRLEPRTGRSHQLRVQCAKRSLPIVGDQTYGDFAANREFARAVKNKRLFLHSQETSFSYKWAGRTWMFSAKVRMPAEFEEFV